MTKVPDKYTNNTLKGPYRPAKYRVTGYDNGVGFTRTFRTLRGVRSLEKKSGITFFNYVVLN